MRVWIYLEKTWGNLGDRRFQVEWEVLSASAEKKVAKDPEYEVDFHWDFDYEQLHFRTKPEAMAAAQKAADSGASYFGRACVEEQVVDWVSEEDRVAEWARVGDREEVS